jgi:diguanylate cyclase (GGDEF)-like protein
MATAAAQAVAPRRWWRRPLSLRSLLVVPVLLQMAGTAGLITLVSFQSNERLANQMARVSEERTMRQVLDFLRAYLRVPQQVIATMADAVADGTLEPQDRATTTRYLWQLHRIFPEAPYLNYGLANGDFIGVGQADNLNPQPYLEVAPAATIERLGMYRIDASGAPGPLHRVKPFADFRGDGWYNEPVTAGRAVWTSIYNWVDAPEVMAMGAGIPIRRDGRLVGVAGVDVFLATISRYLRTLSLEEGAEVYVVEPNGLLVADSSDRLPFRIVAGRGQRRRAVDSAVPAIRDSARALVQRFGDFGVIDTPRDLLLPLRGGRSVVRVEPFTDSHGLDWRVVTAMPESAYLGARRHAALTNLLISLAAVGLSTGLGLMAVNRINRSLAELMAGAEALAHGDLDRHVQGGSLQETRSLAASFNAMAERLRENFRTLRIRNAAVSQTVSERTVALQESSQRLEEEIERRRRAEKELGACRAELARVSSSDPLTGAANRTELQRLLELHWLHPGVPPRPLSLLLLEVDRWRDYNDCFGVMAGDRALGPLARVLREPLDPDHELLARWGGGCFALLLNGTTAAAALARAEALQNALLEQAIPHPMAVEGGRITLSIGIATSLPDGDHRLGDLIADAEAALLRASQGGGNRSVVGS